VNETMTEVFIGVGSNLEDREKTIQQARDLLGNVRGIRILACSRIRETDPVGGPPDQGKYLNAVWQIESDLGLQELMGKLLAIEKQLGRKRHEKDGPRTIDLDILFCGREVIDRPGLTVPHPRAHERGFVLEPMTELAPDLIHPVLKKTMKELRDSLNLRKKNETHPGS